MYTSGQFSGMFRVSKKLLRHYKEIGLLIPSEVDSSNGYLYYDKNLCEKMKKILYLRSLHISLNDIKAILELPEKDWLKKIHDQLVSIRAEQRMLERIETELVSLKKRISNEKELFDFMERKTEFNIRIFSLYTPIYVIGRAARIVHGSPEHMPTIQSLISDFYGDDVPSMIPNRKEPAMRFGICAEFIPQTREFTYMMGDQTFSQIENMKLPDSTRSYVIPSGDYLCVTFSAPDTETITSSALGEGYDKLFGWLGSSDEWESSSLGVAYEVYDNERFEVPSYPEMEIWTPIKPKVK